MKKNGSSHSEEADEPALTVYSASVTMSFIMVAARQIFISALESNGGDDFFLLVTVFSEVVK